MTIRILIADDHPIVREGLRAVLETQSDFEVVAEAATGEEAIAQLTSHHPDIMLLDLEMPHLDGVETIRRIRSTYKRDAQPRIIVFTAFDNDERIIHALRAGANGYLLKGQPRERIFAAMRTVLGGGSLLQPIAALLPHAHPEQGALDEMLTEREQEVLALLAQGLPNKEIASKLVISERTAKFHVSSIMNKLGATNRTEAVSLAAQKGIITLRA